MRRIAKALGAAGALVALVAPASAGAAFGPVGGWGGSGAANGQLSSPHGVFTDGAEQVLVADTGNGRVQRFNANGTFAGAFTTGANPSFAPTDVTFAAGNIYTAGPGGVDVINALLPILTNHWDIPGDGAYGIAVAGSNVYVGDQVNNQIHKFNTLGIPAGAPWPVGGPGGGQGQFSTPYGLTTDAAGDVYVADPGNARVQKLDGDDGTFLAQWTMPSYTVGSISGTLDPRDVAVDGSGRLFVPDAGTHSNLVAVFTAGGALQQIFGTPDNSPSSACALAAPRGISTSPSGALYVGDTGHNAIKVFSESAATPCPTPALSSISQPPIEQPGGGPALRGPDRSPPTISMSGFPNSKKKKKGKKRKNSCVRRNFTAVIQLQDDVLIDRYFLSLNGRPAASDAVGQPVWYLRVTMPVRKVRRQIPRGRRYPVKVKVQVFDTSGNVSSAKRKFRICGAG